MKMENNTPAPTPLNGFEHINMFWDRKHNVHTAKILPGEYYVTKGNEAIATVLGSCVSACIRDNVAKIGGMNHFMLPLSADLKLDINVVSTATRYGNFAMEHLINDILKHGGKRQNLEVKVFGGGKVVQSMSSTNVGEKNIQFVKDYLLLEGIPILSQDVGDTCPRKVLYYPSTGKVKIKRLQSIHNDTLTRRDQQYFDSIKSDPVKGDVEIFQ
jgi:chemotaxis protein CheD